MFALEKQSYHIGSRVNSKTHTLMHAKGKGLRHFTIITSFTLQESVMSLGRIVKKYAQEFFLFRRN